MLASYIQELILSELETMPLKDRYPSEEKDLMPDVIQSLKESLQRHGLSNLELASSRGVNCPRIDLLGTDFWPDIEVRDEGRPVVAIELKLGRGRLASAISQTVGQLLIYKLKYPKVVGFVVHSANDKPKLHKYDEKFKDLCERLELALVVRTLGSAPNNTLR